MDQLPQGWVQKTEPGSNKTYYYNTATNTTQYEPPKATTVVKLDAVEAAVENVRDSYGTPHDEENPSKPSYNGQEIPGYVPPKDDNCWETNKTAIIILVVACIISLALGLGLGLGLNRPTSAPTMAPTMAPTDGGLFQFDIVIEGTKCNDDTAVDTAKKAYGKSVAKTLNLDESLITVTGSCVGTRRKLLGRRLAAARGDLKLLFTVQATSKVDAERVTETLQDDEKFIETLVVKLKGEGVIVEPAKLSVNVAEGVVSYPTPAPATPAPAAPTAAPTAPTPAPTAPTAAPTAPTP